MRANMIYTNKEKSLTLAPQSITTDQLKAISNLKKINPQVDGSYGKYSDGRISVQIGDYGYECAIIDPYGSVTTNY